MQYLFFDIEGANCYNFVSKMCTFGYVITTSSFKVKTKVDVIMNPQADFDKHILQKKMNAYDIPTYQNFPPFNYFYKSIKNILESDEQIIVGWSIENDVKYICDACNRYNLPQIQYKYFDIQKLIVKIEKLSSPIGLQSACDLYKIPKLISHKSDDDAYLTMMITKYICRKLHLKLQDLINIYSDCLSDVQHFLETLPTKKQLQERIKKRRVIQTIKQSSSKKITNPNIHCDDIYAFTPEVIDQYSDVLIQKIRYIKKCGATCTTSINKCNHYVYLTKPLINLNEDVTQISYHDFLKLFSMVSYNK